MYDRWFENVFFCSFEKIRQDPNKEGAAKILLKIDRCTNTKTYKSQILNLIEYAYIIYFLLYYVLVR